MNILVALSRFPWPLEKGDKLRAYYQLKGLAAKHTVHLVTLSDQKITASELEALNFCESIHVIRHGRLRQFGNLLRGISSAIPFQVHYFRSPGMKKKIAELISQKEINVVMVQLIRLGMSLPEISPIDNGPGWFLDYMDCFSIGMENRIPKSKWPVKSLVKLEARRLKLYEQKIASQFDEYSMISKRDAEGLGSTLQEFTHILPNGVGDHFFSIPKKIPEKRYDLIFFGNMGYQPNVESAKYLVEEVLPALSKLGVSVKLCIAGARPAKSVQGYASKDIEVTGFVEEIKEYVLASHLAIAPVIGGQGLQNKLIESMALGIPTLTTPYSHRAMGANEGKEIVVCENADAFAQQIKYLLENKKEALEIGRAGKEFVEKNYQWASMNDLLENILLRAAR